MEKYFIQFYILPIFFTLGSCTLEDSLLDATYDDRVAPSSVLVNGLGDENELFVDVNGDWNIVVSESDKDWLSVEPANGHGPHKVVLKSMRNDNNGYKTYINIHSKGTSHQVEISVDDPFFFKDGFDAGKAPSVFPYPGINYFNGWQKRGPGASDVSYSGESAYVVRHIDSFGTNIVSGNCIYFEHENSIFDVKNINLDASEDDIFTLEFNYARYDETNSDKVPAAIYVSSNDSDYLPLSYSYENLNFSEYWKKGTTVFRIEGTDRIAVKFVSNEGGLYLDDIKLLHGEGKIQDGGFKVSTGRVENIQKTAALLNGSYIYTGSGEIISLGFEYKVSEDDVSNTIESKLVNNTKFQADIASLAEGENYEVRAFAENSEGCIEYGEWIEFTTLVEPVKVNISDIRHTYDGTDKKLPASWFIEGTVVSDKANGNFNASQFAVVDGNGADCGIIVNVLNSGEPVMNPFAKGDKLKISLLGTRFNRYMPMQIDVKLSQMTLIGEDNEVFPINVASAEDLPKYDGMYVSLDNVQALPKYVCRPWGYGVNEPEGETIVEMESSDGSSFKVKTLPLAGYRLDIVGTGNGTIAGICHDNGDGYYIMPQSAEDISLDGPRYGELTESIVYYEDFGSAPKASFAKYTGYTALGQNPNNVTYYSESRDGNVYTSKRPSAGYAGASGGHHGYVNAEPREVFMKGLNTMGKKHMYFTMGASYMTTSPSTEAKKNNLVIKCSSDQGKTWVNVPINVIEEGNSDCIWALIEFDKKFVIPESDDLWFSFLFKKNQGMMDDLKIVCYDEVLH